jgi:hypothetical protein
MWRYGSVRAKGYFRNGSATLMRGKSLTCRHRNPFFSGSPTRGHRPADSERLSRQVEDLPRIGVAKATILADCGCEGHACQSAEARVISAHYFAIRKASSFFMAAN